MRPRRHRTTHPDPHLPLRLLPHPCLLVPTDIDGHTNYIAHTARRVIVRRITRVRSSISFYFSRLMTKPTKWHVRPAKTQINLGIRPVWSEASLSAWRKHGSGATHWAQAKTLIRLGGCPGWSESSLGAYVILLVLSWGGSFLLTGFVLFFTCRGSSPFPCTEYSINGFRSKWYFQ